MCYLIGSLLLQRLASGEEVRLQRNALSVVELPTGLESVSLLEVLKPLTA